MMIRKTFPIMLAVLLARAAVAADWPAPGPDPARAIDEAQVTYFVAVNGDDARDGRTRATAFATMQKAADVVQPGESVLVTKGRYSAGFHVNKEGRPDAWIRFLAEPGAEIRGSRVRKDWRLSDPTAAIYTIPRPALLGGYQRPDQPLSARLEQVFVNGVLLRQVTAAAMLKPRGTFYVDDDAETLSVCLDGGADPNAETVEVTEATWAIAVGGAPNRNFWREETEGQASRAAYVRIDGFTVRHIANFSRMAAIQVRGLCHDIVIENCDVQWVNTWGIGVSSVRRRTEAGDFKFAHEPHHVVIRRCIASNCGVQGLAGSASFVTVESCIIDRNNYKGVSPFAEGGAVKMGFNGSDIIIRGNLARHNNNHGLWLDFGLTNCVFENNFVYGSCAGGILNEVTPHAGGAMRGKPITLAYLQSLQRRGSVIRNNIIVGTRTPGGGGVNNSSSSFARIHNNILAFNEGGAINFGASTREGAEGFRDNRAWANIVYENYLAATATRDEDDPEGRYFDNVMFSNLFVNTRSDPPFRLSGMPATAEEFRRFNKGATNEVRSGVKLFRDPENWDFTLTDPELARRIGFNPDAMRLDWSAYFEPLPAKDRPPRRQLRFEPLDLTPFFNRGYSDEVEGDGKGGWNDQGRNDMSLLPLGRQELDGVPFMLGPAERGVLLLDNEIVKPGGFPESVTIPINRPFSQLYFLYTCTHMLKSTGEVARLVFELEDGTRQEQRLAIDSHLADWWATLGWPQWGNLNDHGAYQAWSGHNRYGAWVTLYYLEWINPAPDRVIRSVTVTTAGTVKRPFLLLGITGANPPAPAALATGDGPVAP